MGMDTSTALISLRPNLEYLVTALKKAIETIMAVNETQNKDRLSAFIVYRIDFVKYYKYFLRFIEEYCNGI